MSSERLRILMVGPSQEAVNELQKAYPQASFVPVPEDPEALDRAIEGADALLGCPRHFFTDELLKKAGQSLKWVHCGGAGIEEYLTPGLVESPVVLTNGKILQGPEIADHAFGLMLALTRNIAACIRGENHRELARPIELRGKTALVVGAGGGIGSLISERCRAFGMVCWGLDAELMPYHSFYDRTYTSEDFMEVLGGADFVLVAAPHTEATYQVFSHEQFRAMKQGAYFFNVSRGKLVNTEALVSALQSGHLKGAGLDVTDPEPLPPDHPLRTLKNVILTPHIAGLSDHNRQRSQELLRQNVRRFCQGLPLLNVVEKRRGY